MSHITIPATGSGDATPEVATDLVSSAHYQYVKLADGTIGSGNVSVVDGVGNLQVGIGSIANHLTLPVAVASAQPGIYVGASIANLPGTQPVSGNVTASAVGYVGASVTNFPATQAVTVSGQPISVSGNVIASVIGYVGASLAGTPTVDVGNFPGTQAVSGNVTASVVGYVGASITNGLSLSGEVGASVANWPYPANIGSATTFLASAYPGIYIGASIANVPAVAGAASQVIVGGSVTIASAVPGLYLGASVAAVDGAGNLQVGIASVANNLTLPIAIASAQPGIYIGASIGNVTLKPSTYIGASVAGPVTASVIGYVGASVAGPIAATASVIGYVGASLAGTPAVTVSNFPGTQPVSGNVTASVVGYVGASVAGGQITASTIGYVGASVTNFPANQTVTVSGQPISVSGNVTASAIGYVGASVAGPITASVIGYVGASVVPGASVQAFNVGGSTIAFPAAAPVAGLGASPYRFVAGASFNNVNVKSSAGTLYNVTAMNVNVNPRYVRLFDKSTQPSPGTDLPRQTYIIPGASAGAGAVIPQPVGLLFANGIGFDITGGSVGDTDQTVTALGDVVLNLGYS